ncbi:hypothetical protein KFU94_54065 [Chloroflexi bacterium TSY]|nr:hypothetical protein [Chloroflexi bacterium TSY]MBV7334253.1 hypothetical protein [Chloroflexi bacterium TSY]MBV7337016.1 hypothetical protein [Chloroflexi bacterium TSY]
MDSHLLTDPAFRERDEAFKTKITIASELVEKLLNEPLSLVGLSSMVGISLQIF